jgi:transcriptional regulator with XRE-family HTH domain
MTDPRKLIGYNVKRLRQQHRYSQERLAEKVNSSANHIGQIEAGKQFASAPLIMKLASVFKVDTPALFSADGFAPHLLEELQVGFINDWEQVTDELIEAKLAELEAEGILVRPKKATPQK